MEAPHAVVELKNHYDMPNVLESTATELLSVGIQPAFAPVGGYTELWYYENNKPKTIGRLEYLTDAMEGVEYVWGRSLTSGKSIKLVTEKDIEEFKNLLMDENGIPDTSGLAITVQYRSDDTKRLQIIEKGDWIDLCADERVEMRAGDWKLINLGVAMKLPEGYEAHIVPRSSTFKKWGVIQANHMGVVDNSYCGPNDWWMFSALALRDNVVIERGERICQFRIVDKQPKLRFVEGKMESPDRGGFGSTGTK